MFGKKKKAATEPVESVEKESDDVVSEEVSKDSSDAPIEENIKQESAVSKKKPTAGETIKLFFTKNLSVVIAFIVFIILFVVGQKMQGYARDKMQNANDYTVFANNRLQAAEYAESQARTAINRHIGGIDEQRHMDDDRMMLDWVKDAFTFNGYDEYMAHREEYLEQLGYMSAFVREIMPSVDGDISLMTELDRLNAELNMHIEDFTTYVQRIDEETGTYYYLAEVTCASQNNYGRTSSSAGKPVLMYRTVVDENGAVSIDLDSFVCYLPSSYWMTK